MLDKQSDIPLQLCSQVIVPPYGHREGEIY